MSRESNARKAREALETPLYGDWQDDARCFGLIDGRFFPKRGQNKLVKEAKAICHRCPVELECLRFALENNEKFGVWGGTSERERRLIRRSLRIR